MYRVTAPAPPAPRPTGRTTQRPTRAPCRNTVVPIDAPDECPAELDLVRCDDLSLVVGDLCEGDGECGTSNKLDNCHNDEHQDADIYRVVSATWQPTLAPDVAYVDTKIRFSPEAVVEAAGSDYATSEAVRDAVTAALVESEVADSTQSVLGVSWGAVEEITVEENGRRRRLATYSSLPALVSLEVAGAASDAAADVTYRVERAAAGSGDAPSLAEALDGQTPALGGAFDASATYWLAASDTRATPTDPPVSAPTVAVAPTPGFWGSPTPLPTAGRGTFNPTVLPVPKRGKKKKSGGDDDIFPGISRVDSIIIIVIMALVCLGVGFLVTLAMAAKSASTPKKRTYDWQSSPGSRRGLEVDESDDEDDEDDHVFAAAAAVEKLDSVPEEDEDGSGGGWPAAEEAPVVVPPPSYVPPSPDVSQKSPLVETKEAEHHDMDCATDSEEESELGVV